ncbi:hypothetical protein [Luteolibacter sp. AS25]|uniref:hypothetical protein n=1 Tax=Luteolibacter sp. AS25 TaxID=3135776 RepID=UPI00398ADD42
MSDKNSVEGRGRQILAGGVVIGTIGTLVVGLLVGWRYIPGWGGEGVGMIAGMLSTPFLMETSFVIIGFLTVVALNIWRRHKEGDEFVSMDFPDDSDNS